jgi:hypothetical protein
VTGKTGFPERIAQGLALLGKPLHDQGESGTSGFCLNVLRVHIIGLRGVLITYFLADNVNLIK